MTSLRHGVKLRMLPSPSKRTLVPVNIGKNAEDQTQDTIVIMVELQRRMYLQSGKVSHAKVKILMGKEWITEICDGALDG
jgi:hypothetical protein